MYYWPSHVRLGPSAEAFRHRGRVLDWRDLKPVPQADAATIGPHRRGRERRRAASWRSLRRETDWADMLEPHGCELIRDQRCHPLLALPRERQAARRALRDHGVRGEGNLYVFCNAEDTPFEGQSAYTKFGA